MRRNFILGRVASVLLLILLYPLALSQMQPATAYAATTAFSNTGSIHIGPYGTGASGACPCAAGTSDPYPSAITVSGVSGLISKVTVVLNNLSHTGPDNIDILLVGPAGQNIIIMSDVGGFNGLSNVTLTFDDAASASLPDQNLITTGTYLPTNSGSGDTFPSPAPAPSTAVALSTFNGTNPNGTWSLYVYDDTSGDQGSIASGWTLNITTADAQATTTSVTSSLNPSFTSLPNNSVTFTATVKKSSDNSAVTTGSVTFKEGATVLQTATAVNASGQATFTTTSLSEGSHIITAEYSGDATFGPSSSSVTQMVDNHTSVTGNNYCNTGGLSIPSSGSATPYPSRIFVSGVTGNIGKLTVDLKNISHTLPDDIDVLLVGPAGQNLILMSDAGSANAISNVNLTFDDAASASLPDNGLITSGTYKPSNYVGGDSDSFPSPAPAASGATTLATFNGTSPNGTWSLYVADDRGGDAGSIAGGWCLTLTVDATPPDTTINANPSNPSNSSSASFSFTGSDNVTPAAALTFECALDAGSFAACTSSKSYSGLSDGSHTFQVRAKDQANNTDTTPASFTWVIDTVAPTVAMSSNASDPTGASPIPVTAQFSENVTGFTAADITAGNATVGNFQAVDGDTYTFDLTPASAGLVTANIAANVAQDTAGNGNTAAIQFSRTFEAAPTVTMSSAAPDPTNTSPIPVTVQFSKSVTGFTAADITPGNATVDNFVAVDGDTYTFDLTPSGQGLVTADIAANVAQDSNDNGNTAATQFSRTFDSVAPSVAMSSAAPDPTNTSPIPVTVTFSENVTGFTAAEITAGNASVANFSGSGASYTFDLVPSGQGAVTADIAANVASDAAGNGNSAATQFTRTYDSVAPDTAIDSNLSNPSSSTSASFTFSGSDAGGSGVASFECKLDGGSFAACSSGKSYSGLADGSHTFQVRAIDAAGNMDATPASFTWVVDTTGPDTFILTNPTDPTADTSASFTFSSSEVGSTFECRLDGSGFTPCSIPADYTGLADGSHTFEVRAIDNLGNADPSPASFTWTVDTAPPDTTIDSNPSNPNNSASASFSFSGTDSGTGVASFECKLDGGSFAACTSPQNYTSLADGSHTFAVRAIDGIGNADPTPASFTWTIDTTAPSVTINQASGQQDATSTSPIHFTAVFNEPVSGFTNSDVTLSGTAGAATAVVTEVAPNNGTTYDVAVSGMTTDGTVIASIAANKATDAAGNGNTASTSTDNTVTFIADGTPPETTITANPTNPTSSASASFSFTGTDNAGGSGVASFECKLDGELFAACTNPKSYSGLSLGSHTFNVRAKDAAGNVDPTPASYTWEIHAATTLLYNGGQIVNVGSSLTPAALLSSSAPACLPSKTVSFSLDANPLTGVAGTYALGTATTNSSGQATMASINTTGWLEGIYTISARFAGTSSCDPSSDTATLTVASPGSAANGGGWYTLSGSGRVNFGFTVRKVDSKCTSNCAYKGQLLSINNGKWRLKGTLTTYSKTSNGQGAASGTGDLYWWNTTLNGGLGDWALAQSGVSYTINFYDSGKSGKSSTDAFGIRIVYTPVAPQPNTLPNSTQQVLKGGDIKVS